MGRDGRGGSERVSIFGLDTEPLCRSPCTDLVVAMKVAGSTLVTLYCVALGGRSDRGEGGQLAGESETAVLT